MGMPWFRMWAEAIDDAKIRCLSFDDRWHFVALLCLKAQGILDEKNKELRQQMICTKFGMDSSELEKVMKRLVTVGLVTPAGQPKNWDKRQFRSDSSAERTRKWRERHRDVTVTHQKQIQKQKQIQSTDSSPLPSPPNSLNSVGEEDVFTKRDFIAHAKRLTAKKAMPT